MSKQIRLNCLGESCPLPLIKAQDKLKNRLIGDILVVMLDNSCAMKSVPDWARKQNYIVEVEEVENGQWDCIIEKT